MPGDCHQRHLLLLLVVGQERKGISHSGLRRSDSAMALLVDKSSIDPKDTIERLGIQVSQQIDSLVALSSDRLSW
eukprot:749798-Hanusia_phi.AAC.3